MGREIVKASESVEETNFNWSSSSSPSSSSSSSSSTTTSSYEEHENNRMPLLALNHVSYVCKSVAASAQFYEQVLGFVLIKRPSSFDFDGAWLFNHGIGIHLLGKEDAASKKGKINPKDNHISFQCTDMDLIIQRLDDMEIEYVTATVKEGGVTVDQLFFHDPDGNMIEICNCQNLPVLPLSSCPLKKMSSPTFDQTMSDPFYGNGTTNAKMNCSGEVESLMMENLALDMIDISF
ncbi:putative sodium/metabolite cotransporter BASS2, chloroplastic-like isoform X1 [Capsicum annuum]|nr:putative sodium/metabolite cotransporter BASS2, chloroplastic-like isoform X1 [Capsicum annuum]